MKKTNFTPIRGVVRRFIFTLIIGSSMLVHQSTGQTGNCSMACNGHTQVSLNELCDTEVTWNMLLNASETSCPGGEFVVTVAKYKNGPAVISSPFVNKAHIGQTLTVEVRDINSGNRCWGEISVEDKMPPQIECENDTLYCHEMRSYAGPRAFDNCQKAAFLHSASIGTFTPGNDGPPNHPFWGGPFYNDYIGSMDAVFGPGNWDDMTYQSLDPEQVFSKEYCYIYMEGSDTDGIAFENFMAANSALVEQWVLEGGRLFINAAPVIGGDVFVGFGGIVIDQNVSVSAFVTDIDHPVAQGPFQPVVNTLLNQPVAWVAGAPAALGHVIYCPPGMGMDTILVNALQEPLMVGHDHGDGYLLIGGMTPSGFHVPQPNAFNLKKNTLEFFKNQRGADVTLTLLNETITPINCDENFIKEVTRTYIATDAQGNESPTCTYSILLRRFPHDEVDCPINYTIQDDNPWHCDDVYPRDANGNPHPSASGVPTVDGIPLWPNQDFYCNINVSYEDLDLPKIGCVEKVMRVWTIREWWCSEEITTTCTQLIEIVDDEGPVLTLPRDMTVTTSTGYSCEAIVDLPRAIAEDACSPTTSVDIQYPGGFLKGQNGGRVRLPVGVNEVLYIAYDECYNSTEGVMLVTVEDKTAPVAVCDKHTVVGLTYDGYAHVYAQTFDDGSFDDCWIDSMAVRRMDLGAGCNIVEDEFGPYATFCCADIANNDIMVVFRVWDESGNYNDCMVEVEVQDKIPPVISCPPNLTINCDYHLDRNDLSSLGRVVEDKSLQEPIGIQPPYLLDWDGPLYDGLAHDNCSLTIREEAEFDLDQCNIGWIYRTFIAEDPNGQASCEQTIRVINDDPFYINPTDPRDTLDDIVWPYDYETFESCDVHSLHPDSLPSGYGRPVATEDKCDLVGITWKDEVFPFAGNNACFKIIRTWKVIDWCQFTNGRYYEWQYQQIIKINNDVAPTLLGDYTRKEVCTYDPTCADGEIELTASAEDDCSPGQDLMWSYEIDEFNTGVFGPAVTGLGDHIDASGPYPVGEHRIKFSFEDRCGNKSFVIQEFEIVNCKAPLAYCQNGIVVDLMPMDTDGDGQVDNGMVEIWAEDFDAGSSHPCGYDLTFSFDADGQELARMYNCDSIANGNRLEVSIYITDENGNQSVCNNFIIVQDNNNACTQTIQSAIIGGRIATEDSELVASVDVKLEGSGSMSMKTKDDGTYAFPPMPRGGSYTVVPQRGDDYMNGVSTADLVAIQRHLLGLKLLDSPYKLIAADANNSRDISARDILELRKLILGVQQELPDNESWRFVDKSYVFANPSNALNESWKESYPINGLNSHMMNIDFIGVKIGDVNGTVKPNELLGTQVRSLAGTLELEVEAQSYRAGEEVLVPVYARDFAGISGYQFTLHFDRDDLVYGGVESGALQVNASNFGLTRLSEGMITTSWNGEEQIGTSEAPLFTLRFTAMRSGDLSEGMYLSSAVTPAEAYTALDEEYGVELRYRSTEGGVFALYQNTPNPFADVTYIRFSLVDAEPAQLTIYDVNGKVIRRYEIDGQAGMNEVRIQSDELTSSGVLYYQLDTKNHTATKRMVVLK